MVKEGIYGKGGIHGKGGHVWYAHPRDMASQCAGGAHPTGMHSCYIFILAMPFLPPADEVVGR